MTCTAIEIYPYKGRKSPVLKQLLLDNIHSDISIINYAHQQYLELFRPEANTTKLINDVLLKIMRTCKAQTGFLALLLQSTVKSNAEFEYLCAYMDVGGIAFQSEMASCKMSAENKSIVSRSITKKRIIISNDLIKDPRSIGADGIPKEHPQISNYLGIPLLKDSKLVGQIGIANCRDHFTIRDVEQIMPLIWFCSNYTWMLVNKDQFDTAKELKLRQEVVTLKDSFIATMSHEIRTPLNGIVGMARLLSESQGLTTKQIDYIRILNECSVQLMELVNDILDFSKITSGGLSLSCAPFDLQKCINGAIDIVRQRAGDKGLDLRKKIPTDLPSTVTGDARRLKQVLINILTNAIKFTERGHVTLRVTAEQLPQENEFDPHQQRVRFEIEDTGIGIAPQDQERIFEVFTKLSRDDGGLSYTNTTPGAGLGLAISRELVRVMGGKISVKSDGCTGSTFIFNVLLEDETDVASLIELHSSKFANKTVIIVDDREDNRMFLMETVYSWGIQTYCFSSAREALGFIDMHKSFDMAIIDIFMPGMSGIELAQAIRERGYRKPLIGLSSIGTDINGKDWFDQLATKPVTKSKLFNMFLKAFLEYSPASTPKVSGRRASKSPLTRDTAAILIAEDDYYNQLLLTETLKTLKFKNFKIVGNGKLCVEEAKKKPYDICLMDVKMPVMDGLEATRLIKRMEQPPVVIGVSASVLESDKSRCFNAGMDGYIPKPIQKDTLESTLASIIERI